MQVHHEYTSVNIAKLSFSRLFDDMISKKHICKQSFKNYAEVFSYPASIIHFTIQGTSYL